MVLVKNLKKYIQNIKVYKKNIFKKGKIFQKNECGCLNGSPDTLYYRYLFEFGGIIHSLNYN